MDIQCAKCGQGISHVCESDLREAVLNLYRWVPENLEPEVEEGIRKGGEANGYLSPGEKFREAAFFGSQGWSYAMFGKEEARTFHALLDNVIRQAGLNPTDIHETLAKEEEAQRKMEKRMADRRASREAKAKTKGQ